MRTRSIPQYPLAILAHPAVFAGLGLLLLNDHVLRPFWPSQVTGKLGDFACMFFMPLIAAALLALPMPTRPRLAGLLGFGLVGGLFAAGKTVAPVHAFVVAAAGALFGVQSGWILDATDLAALLAMFLAWRLWDRVAVAQQPPSPPTPLPVGEGSPDRLPSPTGRGVGGEGGLRTALSVVCLALAAILTMADSPAPDPGICCLSTGDAGIHATSGYGGYLSKDGGLTWERAGSAPGVERGENLSGKSGIAADPNHPQVQYRFAPGEPIERSDDGGQTWRVERQVNESDAALTYYRRGSASYLAAAPLDGLVDPASGNAVFAMGQAGVLVRMPSGEWRRVAVADYRPYEASPDGVLTLVYGETLLAAGLGLLSVATLALLSGRPRWRKILVIVCWLAWLTAAFVGPDLFASGGYGVMMGQMGTFAVLLLLLPVAAHGVYRLGAASPAVLLRGVAVSLAAALLFLLPYVLWATGAVPRSLAIAILACALGAGVVAAAYYWLRHHLPVPVASSSVETLPGGLS